MNLEGRAAIITGASSGIGSATARLFSERGAGVVLVSRQEDALNKVRDTLAAKEKGLVLPADVTDRDQCARMLESAVEHFGQLDVLVNAAGFIASGTISDTGTEDWRRMMQVNLDAPFMLSQLAVPHLERTQGNIVNVSSVTGVRAFPGILSYCVSKAGVDQLTRCCALELAPKKIRVNAVNPGVVVTELHRRGGMDEARYRQFLEHSATTHPLGRIGQPEEVAASILFLASQEAEWITGVTLSVDGGRQLTCAR